MKLTRIAALFAAAGISAPVFATNGMNQAGYGPVSEAMGGTSMAYDNGVAAVINNPATLGFMAPGTARIDVGFGDLRPAATANGQTSTAKDYFMPGLGYARKDGNIAWGVGLMAQGGMGTDFTDGSFWGTLQPATGGYMAPPNGGPAALAAERAAGQSLRNMSEVGVGRVMFPLAFNVNSDLTIGGSIDFVWAGMDIKWLMDGAHFKDLAPAFGGAQTFGTMTGAGVTNLIGLMGPNPACATGCINDLGWGYFDFEKSGKFGQEAKGTGWAGNIGFTYRVSPALTVGGVYHAKTSLSDLKTDSGGASVSFNVNSTGNAVFGPAGPVTAKVTGKVTIKDFQWPETYAVGMSYKANPQWQFTADYKRINWAATMKALNMKFEGSMSGMDMGLDIVFKQNWENQNVFQFGAAYQYSDALAIRFGANIANNPIPDKYVSSLFPAIMKDHYSVGFGYAFSKMDALDGAFVYAPKVSVTNSWGSVSGPLGGTSNSNISLGTDSSFQLMYNHRY